MQEAIKRLDFTPNPTARRLAGNVQCRIGMLYNNPSLSFVSELLLGALSECSTRGHQLLIERCDITVGAEQAAVEKLMQSRVDAILFSAHLNERKPVLEAVRKAGVAVVEFVVDDAHEDVATISIDHYKAAEHLTQHLIGLGHRRIGFIKGHPSHTVSGQRLQGYLSALSGAGIRVDTQLIEQGYFSYQSGLLAAERLLALPSSRPTAVFASNDDMAAAVVATANRLGMKVPMDLSVAGFDDTIIASTIWPGLTTIRQPVEAMGRAAVQAALSEIKRLRADAPPSPAPQKRLRFTLVERESTAAPPIPIVEAI